MKLITTTIFALLCLTFVGAQVSTSEIKEECDLIFSENIPEGYYTTPQIAASIGYDELTASIAMTSLGVICLEQELPTGDFLKIWFVEIDNQESMDTMIRYLPATIRIPPK